MSGFFRRLFSPGPIQRSITPGYDINGEPVPRSVGKNALLAAGYGKDAPQNNPEVRKFKLEGKVVKDSENGTEVLASGGCIKEATSAEALKEAWLRDMKTAFPMGADYNVDYHCTVTEVEEDRDDGDGVDVAAATAAAIGAVTLFR